MINYCQVPICDFHISRNQALDIHYSNIIDDLPIEQAAVLQLLNDRLFMDFNEFHKGIEKVLHSPVFTHEFADQNRMIERLREANNE